MSFFYRAETDCCGRTHIVEFTEKEPRFVDHEGVPFEVLSAEAELVRRPHCGLLTPYIIDPFTRLPREHELAMVLSPHRKSTVGALSTYQKRRNDRKYSKYNVIPEADVISRTLYQQARSVESLQSFEHILPGHTTDRFGLVRIQSTAAGRSTILVRAHKAAWASVYLEGLSIVETNQGTTLVLAKHITAEKEYPVVSAIRPKTYALQFAMIDKIRGAWAVMDWLA